MSPEVINGLFALGGATAGALITGFFSWRIGLAQVSKRVLICSIGNPQSMIQSKTEIGLDIEVQYAGTKLDELHRVDVQVFNAGNKSIEDATVQIFANERRALFDLVPQDLGILHNKIVNLRRKIGPDFSISRIDVHIEYINPNERFDFSLFYEGFPLEVGAMFRGKDVTFSKTNRKNITEANFDIIEAALQSLPGGIVFFLLLRLLKTAMLKRK